MYSEGGRYVAISFDAARTAYVDKAPETRRNAAIRASVGSKIPGAGMALLCGGMERRLRWDAAEER